MKALGKLVLESLFRYQCNVLYTSN